MEADLERPPARLPPRVPTWVILSVLWAAGIVIAYFNYYVLDEPYSAGRQWLLLIILLVSLSVLTFGLLVVRVGRLRLVMNRYWRGQAYPQGDPGDPERLADRQEIEARRELRRGTITRAHYERIIARRQFVHGDISRAQYEERITEIAEGEQWASRVKDRRSDESRVS